MEGLKLIPYIALIITIAGIILGAGVITLSKFKETGTTRCLNSSWTYNDSMRISATGGLDFCQNATNTFSVSPDCCGREGLNLTDQYYAVMKSEEGIGDVAEQVPTVAIIAVMVVIISIIAGVFVYMKYFA